MKHDLPDWVMEQCPEGFTVKQHNHNYYVYKRTSHRIPGHKYPVPVEEYMGTITQEFGYVAGKRMLVETSGLKVHEFGLSFALLSRCPDSWKNALQTSVDETLYAIILAISPTSYLKESKYGYTEKWAAKSQTEVIKNRLKPQRISLYRRFQEQYKVSSEELSVLSSIFVVEVGKHSVLSVVNEEQQKVLDKLNGLQLILEVC